MEDLCPELEKKIILQINGKRIGDSNKHGQDLSQDFWVKILK